MENKTKSLIDQWYDVYHEYNTFHGVTDPQTVRQNWIDATQNMTDYWQKMKSGEMLRIYPTFEHMLRSTIQTYSLLNEHNRRGERVVPESKNTGGRYWL